MFLMSPMDLGPSNAVSEDQMVAELGLRTLPDWLATIYEHIQLGRLPILKPRKLVPPGGYHSPNGIPAGLDVILTTNEMKTDAERIPTEITAQAICYEIINHRVPVYYLAEGFIRAIAATELPHDFTFADLHWPLDAMVLGFPVRFMQE